MTYYYAVSADRITYDEFAYFGENAAEFGLEYTGPPTVRREAVTTDDGRRVSALVWGSTEPELLLIHGGAQNAHTWDTVCLAIDRPLIAVDLPGHGHSDGPADGVANVRRNAQDVALVMSVLAPSARTVVGMSLGGLTAIAMSAYQPDLFETMMLVDVTPGVTREKAKQIADFVNGPTSFDSFDEILERTIEFNPTRSRSSLRRGILHNAEQRDDGTWVWRHARHRVFAEDGVGQSAGGSHRPDHHALWDAVEHHRGPVILARGMLEQSVVDDEDVAELLRRRPEARVENFDAAGHSIQGDMPVELAALIADVLGESG